MYRIYYDGKENGIGRGLKWIAIANTEQSERVNIVLQIEPDRCCLSERKKEKNTKLKY